MNWPPPNRWDALLHMAGTRRSLPEWYHRLAKAYGEPQRHYHNPQHIAECLSEFDQARAQARNAVAVELALWFHDAVYDPRAGDNEEQSARLATQCLQDYEIAPAVTNKVAQLIMATKNHETGDDEDAKIMVDVDLSILGRDPKRFFEYEEQIRKEYDWVPALVFASKRAELLQRFLSRNHLFATGSFRQKYEEQARKNLEESILRLKRLT